MSTCVWLKQPVPSGYVMSSLRHVSLATIWIDFETQCSYCVGGASIKAQARRLQREYSISSRAVVIIRNVSFAQITVTDRFVAAIKLAWLFLYHFTVCRLCFENHFFMKNWSLRTLTRLWFPNQLRCAVVPMQLNKGDFGGTRGAMRTIRFEGGEIYLCARNVTWYVW